jgi:hypothetical protein
MLLTEEKNQIAVHYLCDFPAMCIKWQCFIIIIVIIIRYLVTRDDYNIHPKPCSKVYT